MIEVTRSTAENILNEGGYILVKSGLTESGLTYRRSPSGVLEFWDNDRWETSSNSIDTFVRVKFYSAPDPSKKTENLTCKEARVALAEGHGVQSPSGSWIWNEKGLGFKLHSENEYSFDRAGSSYLGPTDETEKYSIVQPETQESEKPTKTLLQTYGSSIEALKQGKTVYVQFPNRQYPSVINRIKVFNAETVLSVDTLLKLDLAERRAFEMWTEE